MRSKAGPVAEFGERLLVEAITNNGPPSGQPCRHRVGDFVELRTPCAIAVQNEVKAQNKKAFMVVLAISNITFTLTLKATVQYSGT